jgi:hypothetical protein
MKWLVLCVVLAAAPAYAVDPDPISNGKAAEYSLHRIERLVILHQVDPTYQSCFQRLDLTLKTPQTPTDPMFDILASEVAGADGGRMTLEMGFDPIGRPLAHTPNAGTASANPPAWPLKDAVTIAENSLHWLEDQGPQVALLTPFLNLMTSLEIEPVLDDQGKIASALVVMRISEGAPVLHVALDLSANFVSYVIVPATLEPTFASLRAVVLEPRCAKCHAPGQPVERVPLLDLQQLLDSPRELVLPGDSADSGLLIALSRTDDKRMPPPGEGDPLTADELKIVAQWIDQGAKP